MIAVALCAGLAVGVSVGAPVADNPTKFVTVQPGDGWSKIALRIQSRMLAVSQALDIAELENPDMAVSAPVAALITEFDTATNAIAARIQKFINTPNPTPDDIAALQAEVDKLTALGADPANPVPPTV